MNKKQFTGVFLSFFLFLGFDTISTALSWSVSYLVTYPELQEKLHEEISKFCCLSKKKIIILTLIIIVSHCIFTNCLLFTEEKVGLDRSPLLSDRQNLPFLEAFILETLRHSSFLPFTIPHW